MPDIGIAIGISAQSGTLPPSNSPPTAVVWGGSHSIPEDAELGTVIGDTVTFTDPDVGETGSLEMIDDASGLFDLDGLQRVILVGVLDYETATSHDITLRFTDSGGLHVDNTFTITVTDVVESPPATDPPPTDGTIDTNTGEFTNPPVVTTVDQGIKFHGKKAVGASGKFIYNIGTFAANTVYTMRYDPDWSLLANGGVTAMVGFGARAGNTFQTAGLKGDGSTGLRAFRIYGTNWNQTSGFSTQNVGAAHNGSQAGPNWLQLQTSEDGSHFTLRTSADGITWDDEMVDVAVDLTALTTSAGIVVFLESADAGNFSVLVNLWVADYAPPSDITLSSSTINEGDTTVGTLTMVGGTAPGTFSVI